MYSSKSYQLTKEEYNYLLPVLRSKLLYRNERYYFIGSTDDLSDMLDRLKGVYDNYNEINKTIIYQCFEQGNTNPFRDNIKQIN